MNTHPIGIVDSGSGGLSIVEAIQQLLPYESIIYVGDHANIPYGNKSTSFIQERISTLITYLLSKNVKLIVIACNTATIAGIEYFRNKFPNTPIVGVVPVIKTAARESKTKHFIVLSTHYTARSYYQKQLIHRFAPDCVVTSVGSGILVGLIEKGNLDNPEIYSEVKKLLKRFHPSVHDVIVLGCTHYPFLRPMIRAIVGSTVKILDSQDAVARQVKRILEHNNALNHEIHPTCDICTTGDAIHVSKVMQALLHKDIKVHHVTI